MSLKVVIIGRPNVGKSTLFNRLVGRRLALVDDPPGVTRDRREGAGRLSDLEFDVVDTAGLEEAFDETLQGRMRRQTERAVEEADVVILMTDARAGVTPVDRAFADWLRRTGKPIVLVANKCEASAAEAGLLEAHSLGLGEPVAISAEHGEGMAALFAALVPFEAAEDEKGRAPQDEAQPVQLAVVGRPNVGKSTLINRLIGEERLLTGPEAGITRDSIAVPFDFRGRALRLVDTAGLRRRAKVTEKLEKLSVADSRRAIQFAQVVALVLDGQDLLEKQDLTIARQVIEEGRALVIAVNKWDLVADKKQARQRLADRLQTSLPQVRGIPVVTLSALKGQNLDRFLEAVLSAYDVWNRRVPTAKLNEWLERMTEIHPPPVSQGRRIRLRYATQVKTRPPTFAVFASRPGDLPDSYMRYLVNGLREAFDLVGTPVRIHLRKGKNPYVSKA